MGGTVRAPKSLARQAARREPSAGIFGPTTGLDPLLFDEAGKLRPDVRHEVMTRLDQCIRVDSGLAGSEWQDWTRVYVTGGSASEWAGERPNEKARDLDVIVAIDLAAAQGHSAFEGMSAGEAASALNAAFWRHFNADGWKPSFGGTWNLTAFCNQRAWDIAAIKPYAAYDLTDGHWAVKPPHLPGHSLADFDPAVIAHARAVAAEARAILRMPEPLRTREARDLWEHVHAHRCTAFSAEGTGWDDPGNIDDKWLQYAHGDVMGKIRELALAPKTAAAQGYLRNPYHGTPEFGGRPEWSHTWFHGTKGVPDFGTRRKDSDEVRRADLPPDQRKMNFGWTQPNQHLGIHLSPLHEVAHKFAGGGIASTPSSIVHARLRFSNPAVYGSEDHLNIAMADWASKHYPHWHNDRLNESMAWNYSDQEGTHRDFSRVPEDHRERYRLASKAQSLLQWHPHMPEILSGFRQGLKDQGHHGIVYGNDLEGPYITDGSRGGDAAVKYQQKNEGMWGKPRSFSAIAHPDDIEVTHVEHISPWRAEPQPHERTWEDVSDQDEPDEMRDRVLSWHREHGGKMPFKLAARPEPREEQLAAMDPRTRAAAVAQERTRGLHPLVARSLEVRNGQSSPPLTTWLGEAGHPRAGDAYVAVHPDPGAMQSRTGRGPGGEPVVVLHPDRWDYGTLAHEAAHLITDHQTGRTFGEPHGPEGAHGDEWAANYAVLLDRLSKGAGRDFLAMRKTRLEKEGAAASGVPQRPKRTPGNAMVYLDVPHGTVQPYDGQEAGHHVALAYLPRKISDEDFGRVLDRAREAATRHAPMKATVSGAMTFPPGTPPDRRRASVVPVHAPGIHELHDEFSEFDRAHYETYTPHVTRAQLGGHQDDPGPHPEAVFPVTHVHVRRGDEVHSFPLTGPSRREAAVEPEPRTTDMRWDPTPPRIGNGYDSRPVWQRQDSAVHDYVTRRSRHEDETPEEFAQRRRDVARYGPHLKPKDRDSRVLERYRDRALNGGPIGPDPYAPRYDPDEIDYDSPVDWGHPVNRHEAAADRDDGMREEWHPGDQAQFEYHCQESHDSEDAPLWYRSHQQVHILGRDEDDALDEPLDDRLEAGMPRVYRVRFGDGHHGSATEDELLTHPRYFTRPGPPAMPKHAVSGYDGLTSRSGMIYLDLPPGTVRPVPGGVDDHHVTLAYLGKDVSDEAFREACRRAQEAAAKCPPMDGVLRGIDIFPPSKSSDGKVVAFVPAYIGGVGRLRGELEDLSASEHKDWRPHVTLAYLGEGDSLPAPHPAVPLRFDRVHVKRGDDVRSFPLGGGMSRTAAFNTFFHGTSDEYEPGDVIDPRVPHRQNFGANESHPRRVYFAGVPSGSGGDYVKTNGIDHARQYAERDRMQSGGSGAFVYEVEPTGDHWPVARTRGAWESAHPIRIIRRVWRDGDD